LTGYQLVIELICLLHENAKPVEKQGRKAADLSSKTTQDGRATEG
jgi:hypothetical protein